MKILSSLFIIAHGFIHLAYIAPKPTDPKYPFSFEKSWFAGLVGTTVAKPVGILLVVITVIGFLLAGLGLLGVPVLNNIVKQAVIVGSVASIATLVLFWHIWLILGVIISVVILYGALRLGWFS